MKILSLLPSLGWAGSASKPPNFWEPVLPMHCREYFHKQNVWISYCDTSNILLKKTNDKAKDHIA